MLYMWLLQRGHSSDGCDFASTLCKYDLRKGDLFFISFTTSPLYYKNYTY